MNLAVRIVRILEIGLNNCYFARITKNPEYSKYFPTTGFRLIHIAMLSRHKFSPHKTRSENSTGFFDVHER